jgi:hypothetical protein
MKKQVEVLFCINFFSVFEKIHEKYNRWQTGLFLIAYVDTFLVIYETVK